MFPFKWFGTLFDHFLFSITHITHTAFNWQFVFDRFVWNMIFYLWLIVNIQFLCINLLSLFSLRRLHILQFLLLNFVHFQIYTCVAFIIYFCYMRIFGEAPGKSASMGTCTHCIYRYIHSIKHWYLCCTIWN